MELKTTCCGRGWTAKARSIAFTLVELLVVIAIIAIMASLLLPSLRGAVDAAKAGACRSNQRQCYAAAICYANDFLGYVNLMGNLPEGWVSWAYPLARQDGGNYINYPPNIVLCQAERPYKWVNYWQAVYGAERDISAPYSLGGCEAKGTYQLITVNFDGGYYAQYRLLSKIAEPSKHHFLADSYNISGKTQAYILPRVNWGGTQLQGLALRHPGTRANTLHWDGHAVPLDRGGMKRLGTDFGLIGKNGSYSPTDL